MTHAELVTQAKRWLKAIGCRVIISEMASAAGETPDAIGWRSGISILVECKTSRSDFAAEKKKPWRNYRGMGGWRFYLCEPGVINPEDITNGWGLIYTGKKFERVIGPKGNCDWGGKTPFQADLRMENLLLVSALSRVKLKKDEIQDNTKT